MTAATAIVATLALPGYAIDPAANAETNSTAEAVAQLQATESQEVQTAEVAPDEVAADAVRAAFTASTPAEARRAQLAAEYAAWSGPRVGDFLTNPPYPSFSLDQVVAVAMQYQGVPYRFGGDTPAGFDCSGFVQYVYAQFGVALPHSVSGQDAAGVRISRADARPGDLVIMAGHNGIYLGNGMFIDSPRAGGVVAARAIWTDDYWIVRVGI